MKGPAKVFEGGLRTNGSDDGSFWPVPLPFDGVCPYPFASAAKTLAELLALSIPAKEDDKRPLPLP